MARKKQSAGKLAMLREAKKYELGEGKPAPSLRGKAATGPKMAAKGPGPHKTKSAAGGKVTHRFGREVAKVSTKSAPKMGTFPPKKKKKGVA